MLQFSPFLQILVLLVAAVTTVIVLHRLRMPSTLGYLLVGVLVGPYALGLVTDDADKRVLAEYGVVFLLFTIGLNFSLPQLLAMRRTIFALGTLQVVSTTVVVGGLAWLAGVPAGAAFIVGAVAAQSSTTIISKQLAEQGDEATRHGRLGLAMSVFQDVTAVPFVVVIPILGAATGTLAPELSMALLKAAAAFVLLLGIGRVVLRPLFRTVAAHRSPELFTLTVLLVSLVAAGITYSFGLSLALGAFIAGMILGDTEFRHQVEATIRPFRDVLLGLFFVTIGMLLDLQALPGIWHWALAGAAGLLVLKAAIVTAIVRWSTAELATAIRTGVVVAVGGEFGFALLAIALEARAIEPVLAQVLLTSVFFTMIAAPFAMRRADAIASLLTRHGSRQPGPSLPGLGNAAEGLVGHVIVTGFGRVGQNVARFLGDEGLHYVALELDPAIVRDAHAAGLPVYYGDGTHGDLLEAAGLARARLVVVTQADVPSAEKVLDYVRHAAPDVPIMVRTRDEAHVAQLLARGATEVVPETLEAALMIAAHVLLLANVPAERVMQRLRLEQGARYRLFREHFLGDTPDEGAGRDRLDTVTLETGSVAVGQPLGGLGLGRVRVTDIVRSGRSLDAAARTTRLESGDVIVLSGPPLAVEEAKNRLLGLAREHGRSRRQEE